MARTKDKIIKPWIIEALNAMGGSMEFHSLVRYLEDEKKDILTPEDFLPQKGHPKDTQFKYYCRWAVTNLRNEGKVKRGSPRGIVEIAEQVTTHENSGSENTYLDSGRHYNESCSQILGRYIQDHFNHREERSRSEIKTWFAENYPLFKTITVQCQIEKFTTNCRSRVHYNAGSDHDLLFRVGQDWNRLRLYNPEVDPPPITPKTARLLKKGYSGSPGRGRYYSESHMQIMKRYVEEHFHPGEEQSLDQIVAWFALNYPKFQLNNLRNDIKYFIVNHSSHLRGKHRSERDLLFAVDGDWKNRLRQYCPEEDPPHSHSKQVKEKQVTRLRSLLERHRLLLKHLSQYGELTKSEQERFAITHTDIESWLDGLLVERPSTFAVSPLFLWTAEGDSEPARFTTLLATKMTEDSLAKTSDRPIASLEEYIWKHFGHWHLSQPHPGNEKWHGYLRIPSSEPADRIASEKLDLFSHLPAEIISGLVRDTSFLSLQHEWSADAATGKGLGPLSRQMKLGIRRPLFLSNYQLSLNEAGGIHFGELPEPEVLIRFHVVAGLSLGSHDEWRRNLHLSRDDITVRLLEHPVYACIVQFEIQRMIASLTGEMVAHLYCNDDGSFCLEINGIRKQPLWQACRTLLEQLGFWPATTSVHDAEWKAAVRSAISNLVRLGILEKAGNRLRIASSFASKIKAHPSHPQNRGEKAYRVKMLEYLKKISE